MNHERTQKALVELLERERLPNALWQTIASVYEPLADRLRERRTGRSTPYLVGLCGPQGSGKSTMAAILRELLVASDVSVAILALDDFYLTRGERQRLASRVHPLLATRGVPGTHDVRLLEEALEALGTAGNVVLPVFDKASDDRRPPSQWTAIDAPPDVILFEGWCIGARPQSAASLHTPINALEANEDPQGIWRTFVNDRLREDYQHVFERIDELIVLRAPTVDAIYEWRAEQERKLGERLAREGRDASGLMSTAALQRFIAHYERLTRHIMNEMPGRADLLIELDADRHIQRVRSTR
jgi:D-glycerate 3-kinase